MGTIVLRLRVIGGGQMDVSYEDPDRETDLELLDHVTASLAEDGGVLRCRHGDRVVVVYGRGVAGFEVSPRGAVL
jgi:hypothetical protein